MARMMVLEPADSESCVKLTGEELRMTVLLRIMQGAVGSHAGSVLERRLRSTPRGWMQFRQAMGLMYSAMEQMRRTIPNRQIDQINATIQNGEVCVKLRRAGAYDDDLNVVRANDLAVIVSAAMRAECMLCVKGRADIKRCALRKAMEACIPPETYETSSCVYRDHALSGVFPDADPVKI